MALSWLSALKAVPWVDVVQAAPGIVQGARKLFTAAKDYAGAQNDAQPTPNATGPHGIDARLQPLEAAVDALQSEQRSTAELIRSLAEQNASIIAALEMMRVRVRILTGVCAGLAIALTALALTVALR